MMPTKYSRQRSAHSRCIPCGVDVRLPTDRLRTPDRHGNYDSWRNVAITLIDLCERADSEHALRCVRLQLPHADWTNETHR